MFGQAKNSTPPWKLPGAIGWDGFVEDSLENEKTESKAENKEQEVNNSFFKGREGTLFIFSQTGESENRQLDDKPVTTGGFDYAKWLGMGADVLGGAAATAFSETKTAASAISELAQPFIAKPEAPKKDPAKEAAKKAAAQMKLQQIIQQTQVGIRQAQESREVNEEIRFGTADLSTEQLSKESGTQANFRSKSNTYTRAFLGLKAVWGAKKQLQKQSAYQITAGRGKNAVNLNAVTEGGTGGAKMNISSTGGGAG